MSSSSEHKHANEAKNALDILPDEVFALILIETVGRPGFLRITTDSDEESTGDSRQRWQRRVMLTLVCKKWRSIALECPTFWAGAVLCPGYQGLSKMLPRWKGYPRSVAISYGHDVDSLDNKHHQHWWEGTKQLLQPEKLRELCLFFFEDQSRHMDRVSALLSQKTPRALRALSIFGSPQPEPLSIPAHVFKAYVHRGLRYLKIHSCAVDWNSLSSQSSGDASVPNLISLDLSFVEPPPPSSILNSILDSSQQLQHLHLQGSLPDDFIAKFKWAAPALRKCHIEGDAEPVISILRQLLTAPFPATSDVRLKCMIGNCDAQLGRDAIDCFTRFMQKSSLLQGKALELDDDEFWPLVTLWERTKDKGAVIHSQLELPADALESLLIDQVCIPEIRMLQFQWQTTPWQTHDHSLQDWVNFFTKHPKLEILRFMGLLNIEQGGHVIPLQALTHVTVHDTEGPGPNSETTVLPRLQKLCFQQLIPGETFPGAFLDALEKTLVSRNEQGAPIAKVQFQRCAPRDEVNDMKRRSSLHKVTEVVGGDENDDF